MAEFGILKTLESCKTAAQILGGSWESSGCFNSGSNTVPFKGCFKNSVNNKFYFSTCDAGTEITSNNAPICVPTSSSNRPEFSFFLVGQDFLRDKVAITTWE
jgi:hypothetical protein